MKTKRDYITDEQMVAIVLLGLHTFSQRNFWWKCGQCDCYAIAYAHTEQAGKWDFFCGDHL